MVNILTADMGSGSSNEFLDYTKSWTRDSRPSAASHGTCWLPDVHFTPLLVRAWSIDQCFAMTNPSTCCTPKVPTGASSLEMLRSRVFSSRAASSYAALLLIALEEEQCHSNEFESESNKDEYETEDQRKTQLVGRFCNRALVK